MIWQILKWTLRLMLAGIILMGMSACTMLGLNYASLETENRPDPTPELTLPFNAEATRATLEAELYGPWPGELPVSVGESRIVDADYLGGRGTLEEVLVTIGAGDGARTFPIVIAIPNQASERPVPLVISQTFSDNCSVFPNDPVTEFDGAICEGSNMTGFVGFAATNIFGTYIAYAPIDRYFDAGLAYASFPGWSFVPDSSAGADLTMADLEPGPAPTSALMAWAFGFHAAAGVFADDPRIRGDAIAAIGHSRYGKSALIASGWSDRIAAAIAHQSGFGGGSSSRSKTGETLVRMAKSYPHWLRPDLAEDLESGFNLTLDQHFLLALSAPKPIFLGNGRRDVWSDPNSSFVLAQAADPIYEASGVEGLSDGATMRSFDPAAEISYWLRVGGHSVVSEDIDAFTAFMTAHFGSDSPKDTTLQTAR
ncbi:MAG: glucuronyl esterase domain-containing protein [Henriciella sp.]